MNASVTTPAPAIRLPVELALLTLLATLWGASYTFIKLGVATIPPVTLIALRTLIAGSVLLLILRARGIRLPRDLATWRSFAIQACINSVIPFTLIAWAETQIEASLAAILNSTTPIFTFLLTWAVTRHEAVTLRKALGTAAGLTGICLIIGLDALNGLGRDLWAQVAMVAATLSYAVAAIFGKGFRKLDPMLPATGSLICGAALLIPLSLLLERPWMLSPSSESLLALLGLSLFSTALAFVIYFRLLHTLGSVGTTSQSYLRIPIGVGIGVVFLGETLAGSAWLGLAFVFVGVAAMSLPTRAKH